MMNRNDLKTQNQKSTEANSLLSNDLRINLKNKLSQNSYEPHSRKNFNNFNSSAVNHNDINTNESENSGGFTQRITQLIKMR